MSSNIEKSENLATFHEGPSINYVRMAVGKVGVFFTLLGGKFITFLLSPAEKLQVIYLQLTCDWKFELLAMACNKSFNILKIISSCHRK